MPLSKDDIRAEVRRRRANRDVADFQRAGTRIAAFCEILLGAHQNRVVMCYVSHKGEAPTHDIIRSCLARGQRVCVPWVDPSTKMIAASELHNFATELSPGFAGILEPRDTCRRPVEPKDIDILLVPAVAFDLKGRRVGRGEGYFDRYLAICEPTQIKIGLALSWQVFEGLPHESHDVAMDLIVTEEGVIPVRKGLFEE